MYARQNQKQRCTRILKLRDLSINHFNEMNREKMIEDDNDRVQGFKRGLEADKILGSADDNGELMYLIQWWVICLFVIRKCTFVKKKKNVR